MKPTHTQTFQATVEYVVDTRGLPSAKVLTSDAICNTDKLEWKKKEKRGWFYIKIAIAAFFLAPVVWTSFHMVKYHRNKAMCTKVLQDFYARAQPEKVDSASKIAAKYAGFEEILYKRLEATYPGHKVSRPGAKPKSQQDTTSTPKDATDDPVQMEDEEDSDIQEL